MSRCGGVYALIGTMLVLGACSAGPLGPVDDVSVTEIAGRYVIRRSSVSGGLVADTLFLGPDKRALRHSYHRDETDGTLSLSESSGSFEISGSDVAIRFHFHRTDSGYGYGVGPVMTMTALGRSGRVTRLTVDPPGWQASYDRVFFP